jgi:DNA repair protein RadA/Sms
VLERRAGIAFHDQDVFVNVTGGVRLVEPATDLAVVAALVSSVTDRPLPVDALFLGEVGLGGEVRPVPAVDRRLAEAARLGFRRVYAAAAKPFASPIETVPITHVVHVGRQLAV